MKKRMLCIGNWFRHRNLPFTIFFLIWHDCFEFEFSKFKRFEYDKAVTCTIVFKTGNIGMILYNENGVYGLQIPYIYFFWEFFSNICKRGKGVHCIVIWITCVTNLHFWHQFSRTRNLIIHLHKDIQFYFLANQEG